MSDATTAPVPTAPARTGPRPEAVVVVAVIVLVLVALLMKVTLDDDPGHRVAVDRGGLDRAVLTVASGADTITVRAADVGGDLAVVTTPRESRISPVADLDGDDLVVRTTDLPGGEGGPADVVVQLSRDVRWDVVVAGGSQRLTLDLAGAPVGRVDVRSGQGSIDATLPQPAGLLAMAVAGGAGSVAVHVPDGVPVRLGLAAGAGSAALDDDRRSGLGAGTSMTTPGWTGSGDRVEVDATSGVGTATVDRRTS